MNTRFSAGVEVARVVTWEQLLFYFTPVLMSDTGGCLAQEHLKGKVTGEMSAFLLTSCFVYSNGHLLDHKVTPLTVRRSCHMEKYSTRNVNTSLVGFCSGQAFNGISSCATSPLGAGKRKDIIQIIKFVRSGWKIVSNTANITRL